MVSAAKKHRDTSQDLSWVIFGAFHSNCAARMFTLYESACIYCCRDRYCSLDRVYQQYRGRQHALSVFAPA